MLAQQPLAIPSHIELEATPFFPQTAWQCGPAALATVLGASGVDVLPEQLTPQVYLPERKGSLQVEMLSAARRQNRIAPAIDPTLTGLLNTLAEGYPVVVLQNLSLPMWPRWHYAVAVGYQLDPPQLILRSGTSQRVVVPMSTFERTWARSSNWAMVTLRSGELPRSVPEPEYRSAVLAYEKTAPPEQVRLAYQAAVARWPDTMLFWMGLGNAAFTLQHYDEAEQAFRRAAQLPGEQDSALNNLALALAAQGRRAEAIEAAEQAIAAGGRFAAAARATLSDLQAQGTDPKAE
jgi:tetratricopeptide (TPR) repeat protein